MQLYLSKVNDTSYALIKKLIVILMHENNDILKKTFNLSKTTTKTTKIRRIHKHSTNKFTFQNCSDFKQACYNHIWIPSEQRWSISNENAGFKWCTNQINVAMGTSKQRKRRNTNGYKYISSRKHDFNHKHWQTHKQIPQDGSEYHRCARACMCPRNHTRIAVTSCFLVYFFLLSLFWPIL